MNVLLIDDEPEILNMMSRLFERSGYNVLTANNGNDGIEKYISNKIDLVVTDIIMPDKEGIEMILHILRHNENCKIIAVSGGGYLSPEDYLETAREIGVKKTFTKPINPQELLHAAEELMNA